MYVCMYDRKVGEKRGDWRKGKKNKMTLFHETCRINADLGLVPVPGGFAWGRGLEGFMSRPLGSEFGRRACMSDSVACKSLYPCRQISRPALLLSLY